MQMTPASTSRRAAVLALGCAVLAHPEAFADANCAGVARAASAALAQARIHAAIDAQLDPEAVKAGMKPMLMHSIVIDRVQYSNALRPRFARTALESTEMRTLATDLGPFMVDRGCKAAGSARIAQRDATVYTAVTDLGRGEVRLKLWIDKASGLPLRAVSDEPEADIDAVLAALDRSKGRSPDSPKAGAPRKVATHAYLFGDAVKPPDAQGAVDPAALATLQALLRAAP